MLAEILQTSFSAPRRRGNLHGDKLCPLRNYEGPALSAGIMQGAVPLQDMALIQTISLRPPAVRSIPFLFGGRYERGAECV